MFYLFYLVFRIRKIMVKDIFFSAINENDIVIDCAGISFYDLGDNFSYCLYNNLGWWLRVVMAKTLKVPVIKFTQSFGVNRYFLTKWLAKNALRKVDLIIVRDNESRSYLLSLGIKRDLLIAPDVVFALNENRFSLDNPYQMVEISKGYERIVGICLNSRAALKNREYSKIFTNFLIWLKTNYPTYGIFFLINRDSGNSDSVDHELTQEVLDSLPDRENIFYFKRNVNPIGMIDIISHCDMLIGSRYHSLVFALLQKKPIISIGWSHKYSELCDLFGIKNLALDAGRLDLKILKEYFREVSDNLDLYRDKIKNRIETVKVGADSALVAVVKFIGKI